MSKGPGTAEGVWRGPRCHPRHPHRTPRGVSTDWSLRPSQADAADGGFAQDLPWGWGRGPSPKPPPLQLGPQRCAHTPPAGRQNVRTQARLAPAAAVKPRPPQTPPAPDASPGGPGREVGTGQRPPHRPACPAPGLPCLITQRAAGRVPLGCSGSLGGGAGQRPPALSSTAQPWNQGLQAQLRPRSLPRAQVPTRRGVLATLQSPGRRRLIHILWPGFARAKRGWCRSTNQQDPQPGPWLPHWL